MTNQQQSDLELEESENQSTSHQENTKPEHDCASNFSGLYETSSYGDIYQLEIKCLDHSLKARLTGPAPQGEHGMFYFLTHWENVLLTDSLMSFGSFHRELYSEPISLKTETLVNSSGGENVLLNFEIQIYNDALIVKCKSEDEYDCYFELVELFKTDNK